MLELIFVSISAQAVVILILTCVIWRWRNQPPRMDDRRERSPRAPPLPTDPTSEERSAAAARLTAGMSGRTVPSPGTPDKVFEGSSAAVVDYTPGSKPQQKTMPKNDPEESAGEVRTLSNESLIDVREASNGGLNYVITKTGTHFHRASCTYARRSKRVVQARLCEKCLERVFLGFSKFQLCVFQHHTLHVDVACKHGDPRDEDFPRTPLKPCMTRCPMVNRTFG